MKAVILIIVMFFGIGFSVSAQEFNSLGSHLVLNSYNDDNTLGKVYNKTCFGKNIQYGVLDLDHSNSILTGIYGVEYSIKKDTQSNSRENFIFVGGLELINFNWFNYDL